MKSGANLSTASASRPPLVSSIQCVGAPRLPPKSDASTAASFPWFASVLTMVSTPECARQSTVAPFGKLTPFAASASCAEASAGRASALIQ
jgi:hypothetical protein